MERQSRALSEQLIPQAGQLSKCRCFFIWLQPGLGLWVVVVVGFFGVFLVLFSILALQVCILSWNKGSLETRADRLFGFFCLFLFFFTCVFATALECMLF